MATGKKSTKTSKTAHVLNVITGAGAETGAEAPDSAAVVSPVHPPIAPILEVARANDDALANTILEALKMETETDKPLATESSVPTVPPLQAQESESQPETQDNSVQATAAVAAAQTEESFPKTAEFPSEDQPLVDAPTQPGQKYYNVIQALVEDKAPKYMQMLGMCMCARCQADVKALALSNLTPKYIVMQPSQITPMFSVYEGKFGAAVTAQIISACRMVRENPRHQ